MLAWLSGWRREATRLAATGSSCAPGLGGRTVSVCVVGATCASPALSSAAGPPSQSYLPLSYYKPATANATVTA